MSVIPIEYNTSCAVCGALGKSGYCPVRNEMIAKPSLTRCGSQVVDPRKVKEVRKKYAWHR